MRKTVFALAALVGCVSGTVALAQAAPAPVLPYGEPITLEQAKVAVAAAETEARRAGITPTLAVVEPSGELVLVEKGTGGSYGTLDVAISRARSAARFRVPTADFDYTRALPPGMAAGLGGVPLVIGNRIVGAIGQAGGPGDSLVRAAAAALR